MPERSSGGDPQGNVKNSNVQKKHPEWDVIDTVNHAEAPCERPPLLDQTNPSAETMEFTSFDIFLMIVSISTYLIDLGMYIYVACMYYQTEYTLYATLTLAFLVIPALTMSAFSLRWYVMDMESKTISEPMCTKWVIRAVCLLLPLAPVLRYIDSLIYGLKSRVAAKRNDVSSHIKYYTYMVSENADASLLRVFAGFMEAAPQVTLQLYVLIYHYRDENSPYKDDWKRYGVMLSILTSLVSVALSLCAYHRSSRCSQPDKANMSISGTALQFVWHFCIISSRVFALSVLTATSPILFVVVCVAHWLAMLAWLIVQEHRNQNNDVNHCEEAMLNLGVAFVYVFTFFKLGDDEPTRYKHLAFYLVCFVENTIFVLTWFFSSSNVHVAEDFSFRVCGIVGDYVLFFVGIFCMVVYYVCLHPSPECRSKIRREFRSVEVHMENSEDHNRGIFPCV